jgi:hypothetical protein
LRYAWRSRDELPELVELPEELAADAELDSNELLTLSEIEQPTSHNPTTPTTTGRRHRIGESSRPHATRAASRVKRGTRR